MFGLKRKRKNEDMNRSQSEKYPDEDMLLEKPRVKKIKNGNEEIVKSIDFEEDDANKDIMDLLPTQP
jgi:hypothetical protein